MLGLNIAINPFLEAFHQGNGHRDDIAISQQRIKKYKENISYFLHKHPSALSNYNDPVDHLINGQNFVTFQVEESDVLLEFHDHLNIEAFKEQIISIQKNSSARIVILDFTNNSNLDVWIQALSLTIYYFPISRAIDVVEMQVFITEERRKENSLMLSADTERAPTAAAT